MQEESNPIERPDNNDSNIPSPSMETEEDDLQTLETLILGKPSNPKPVHDESQV